MKVEMCRQNEVVSASNVRSEQEPVFSRALPGNSWLFVSFALVVAMQALFVCSRPFRRSSAPWRLTLFIEPSAWDSH